MATNPTLEDMQVDTQYGAEESPEQIEQSAPEYGENNRDLPQQLKDAIGNLIKKFQLRDMYDRRIEVLTDRMLRFYDDGVQHIYPNWGTGVYQIGTAGGYVDIGNGNQIECPEFMGAYNIFRARRRSIHAVLTQNPPGIDWIPIKSGQPEDEQSAEIAEGYRMLFDRSNDVKSIQEDMARMMELSGRTISWTHTVKDSQRWGFNDEGEPRSMETTEIFGTLESKVPIACKSFQDLLFCFLYKDKDKILCKAENNWIRDKITAGEAALGESDWERYCRLGVRQARKGAFVTGQAYAHLTTEMNAFIRPGAFEDECCDDPFVEAQEDDFTEDGEQFTVRDKLRQLYPDGLHAVYIGKTYSQSWNEAMDDALCIGFPDKRDGMTGGALMEPMKVIQDEYNDMMNAERENYDKGWPAKYFAGSESDYDSIIGTRSAPGNFHLIKEPVQGDVNKSVFQEQGFDIPNSFVEAKENLRGAVSQDVTGALPALQGASGPDQTASGQAMDRAQAMGQLGPSWANEQRMWAVIYTQAAILASNNPDHGKEVVVAKADGTKVTLQLSKIRKGTFRAVADVDSSFPESTSAKRANMTQFLTLVMPTPLGAAVLDSPDNWNEIVELNGNPNLVLKPAIAYKKQNRELEILLSEPPKDNKQAVDAYNQQHASATLQAMAAGLPEPPYDPPPPMLPSIMPELEDYHDWEMKKCDEYLSSEDCWLRQNVGTPEEVEMSLQGIQNVRLHRMAHFMMMQQEAPTLPPPAVPTAPPPAQGPQNAPEVTPQVAKNVAAPGSPGAPTL